MTEVTLLPADSYIVISKSIITEYDKKTIVNLYQPLIGAVATSLYFELVNNLNAAQTISDHVMHHHLMVSLKCGIATIKKARESLEAFGLLKSYAKPGNINEYVYELYAPLNPLEFFNHPILSVVLYSNIGAIEYERLKECYKDAKVDLKDFVEVTKKLDDVYDSSKFVLSEDLRSRRSSEVDVNEVIDFDAIISSIPKGVINERCFNKKTRELINNLAYVYNIDTLKMTELIRSVLNEYGNIDKSGLRLAARKDYQFKNGALPTLVYRTQPDYLKSPSGDNSKRGRIINIFENTSVYDFLRYKNHNSRPSASDLKIAERLLNDFELPSAVVNVLIDYVLRKNNNKLTSAYVETIASQWKRAGLKTAKDAMEFAEKEHQKVQKKNANIKSIKEATTPVWFNQKIEDKGLTEEEEKELKDMLKEFK